MSVIVTISAAADTEGEPSISILEALDTADRI
jgi:hypothetical protein